jgi:hypothetical protein
MNNVPDSFILEGSWEAAARQLGHAAPTCAGECIGKTRASVGHLNFFSGRPELVADEPVGFELVSGGNFRITGKNTGNIQKSGPKMTTTSSLNPASIAVFGKTPCEK